MRLPLHGRRFVFSLSSYKQLEQSKHCGVLLSRVINFCLQFCHEPQAVITRNAHDEFAQRKQVAQKANERAAVAWAFVTHAAESNT